MIAIPFPIVSRLAFSTSLPSFFCLSLPVQDSDSEKLLHYEFFSLKKRFAALDHVLEFFVPISDPMPPQYFVRVVSDR